MERKREHAPQVEPASVEDAVSRFIEGDTQAAIAFLRKNREEVGEFCLQIRDRYSETDTATPFLEISKLIQALL